MKYFILALSFGLGLMGCISPTMYSNDQRYIRRELEDLHERIGQLDGYLKGVEERVEKLEFHLVP